MLSLPNLAPPDCYTLWYTSASSPNPRIVKDHDDQDLPHTQNQHRNQNVFYRSPLTNLRLDEEFIRSRKKNIMDYGADWLKPPGVSKSLQQMREDEREMREHEETLRRERLAQELAEAGAEAELGSLLQEEEDEGIEEMADLDDEIPEANSSELDLNEESDFRDDGTDQTETSGVITHNNTLPLQDDLYRREILVHNRLLRDDSSTIDEQDLSGMLEEEDLIHEQTGLGMTNLDIGMNQDMDLDDDIPEGDAYEHTDIEEEISSSSQDEDSSFQINDVGNESQ
ncbi:hypothetical protein HI914_02304 [Erysiphe necator]|nr:hypothetical protein HI914_02304 [Erysiphe necator]